ncbi:MAG: hypothetical protein K2R98_11000 [Gemmataceae bacterium]|nr:hypothetical protein [Gemmataceae bacterium]
MLFALWVVGGVVLVLAAIWWGYKCRHFPGPPSEIAHMLCLSESPGATNSPDRGA